MQTAHTTSRRFAAILLRCIGATLAFTFASLALADPPMRVARLGYFSGAVSFSPAGETTWVASTLNRPVVTGDRLWADDRGRVELQIGSAMVRLGTRTLFTLTNLDDRIAQMNLQDGTIHLRVRRLDRNQVVEVDTPNLAFVIRQEGEYRITVDAARDSTEVRTRSGRAEVFGNANRYTVGLGRAYRFYGAGLADYEVLTMPRVDEFDRWCQARDRRYETSTSARYVSRDVIGYQDLDQYGSWSSVPQYGNVWTPTRVASNWAPYRDGHWSWVEPWGWTWVDDLPWGFAVSHYGRWINDDGRWGWVPGPANARAVYAPALVAFIGGSNFQISASSGSVGAVGWFPLGPREVYRPAYAVSREYFTNVNISNTVINNTTIINNYDNRNATTVLANTVYVNQSVPGAVVAVPTTTFVQAQPVARAAMRVPDAAIMAAAVTTLAAVAPVRSSVLGAAPPRAMPPQVAEQRFVAQSQPPAAPVAFAVRERALAANPGKPVETAVLATLAPPLRGTPGNPGNPGIPPAAIVAPRVDIVTEGRTSGAAVAAPPPRAPGDRSGIAEQRGPQAMPPAAQAQPAPAAPDAARPGNRPSEAPARAVISPPVPATPAATAPPPATRMPPPAQEAPRPGNRPSEAPGRTVAAPPAVPGAVAPPAPPPAPMPSRPGNSGREQREAPPPAVAPTAPVRGMPPPQAQPQAQPAPAAAPAQPAARTPTPPAPEAQRPGNRPSEAPGRTVPTPPAPAAQPAPTVAPPAPTRPGNSAREQRDAPPVAAPVQAAPPPPPARVPPAARQPQPPAPAVESGAPAPVEPQRGRPEPAAARPQPVPAPPPPAATGRPAEPPATIAPTKPGNGERRPNVVEEKKGEKVDEDGRPLPDDKERKRR